jgi:hypothetical protein
MIVASCRLITGYSEDFAEVALCRQELDKAFDEKGPGTPATTMGCPPCFWSGLGSRRVAVSVGR